MSQIISRNAVIGDKIKASGHFGTMADIRFIGESVNVDSQLFNKKEKRAQYLIELDPKPNRQILIKGNSHNPNKPLWLFLDEFHSTESGVAFAPYLV